MTVNRFYKPTEIGYIDTYVPINFDQLYKIGVTQKAAVDEARKELNTQQKTWAEFQSLSDIDMQRWGDLTYNNPVIRKYVERAAADPDAMKDAAFRAGLQQAINNLNYADMGRLKQNAKAYEVYEDNKAKLIAAGRYAPWMDKINVSQWDTLGKDRMLTTLSPMPYKSLEELGSPYVEGIEPTYYGGNRNPLNPNEVRPWTSGWNAITYGDIADSLQYTEIINTPQGAAWRERYQQLYGEDADNKLMEHLIGAQRKKIVSTPIDDTLGFNAWKTQLDANTEIAKARAQHQASATGAIGLEDALRKEGDDKRKAILQTMFDMDPEFAGKYTKDLDNLQLATLQLTEALNEDPDNKDLEQKRDFTFNQYVNLAGKAQDEAYGRMYENLMKEYVLQQDNGNMSEKELNKSIFDLLKADTANELLGGDYHFNLPSFQHMWGYALKEMSQKVSNMTGFDLNEQLFGERKSKNELGFSISGSKTLSPRSFIYNTNQYLRNRASASGFGDGTNQIDLESVQLDRGSWFGGPTDINNISIEERFAAGELGTGYVQEITGILESGGSRNYIVEVAVPIWDGSPGYSTLSYWLGGGLSSKLAEAGYELTHDEEGRVAVKITTVIPDTMANIDKKRSNSMYQKEYGTTKSRDNQIFGDDANLMLKNYTPSGALR